MVHFRRTHTCGALRIEDVGQEVLLTGWVHRHRNLGGLLFIDLRDRYGVTQVLIDPKKSADLYAACEKLRQEFVIAVKGVVVKRQDPNPNLPTGLIEILPTQVHLLSKAEVPPFTISDDTVEVNEELRLKYRYLDMRKGVIINNLQIRHKAMMSTRNFMDGQGFLEVVTPILGKSTPEGARDYLVPSRVYPGTFYALPQSPQMFKQILMIGGLDRYFQIALCFRDEDLRADRQPEFAQIDIEMSFATQEELFPIIENLMRKVFLDSKGILLSPKGFRRMTYADCMEYYGCDKPDLRYEMRLVRLDDLAKDSTFAVFHNLLAANGVVKGLCVKGGAELSRKQIDEYAAFLGNFGIAGLTWLKVQETGFTSSIAKFLTEEQQKKWQERLGMEMNDLGLVIAGPVKKVNQALDHLRRKIARDRNLIKNDTYEFLWVTDFPLFTWNEEESRLESEHHPFTSPNFEDLGLLEKEPLKARSSSYDLVLNGSEIASGSQRIHDGQLQEYIFQVLGLSPEERAAKFGFFIEALKYGTPPHIGIALGFDRICMILSNTDGIRDVIAFPKTQKAADLMTEAPSLVSELQLKELSIKPQSSPAR